MKFTRVPSFIIFNPHLTPQEKTVLITLLSFNPCYPSHTTLSKWTGLSGSTIDRILRGLKKKNILTWKKGNTGRNNHYKLNKKSMWDTAHRWAHTQLTHELPYILIIERTLSELEKERVQNSEEHEKDYEEYLKL